MHGSAATHPFGKADTKTMWKSNTISESIDRGVSLVSALEKARSLKGVRSLQGNWCAEALCGYLPVE